jgi:simple sugar transport system permease protein
MLVGVLVPALPFPASVLLAGAAAVLGGLAWGAIPGWLRARRGSHEVISTIMMNFVAAGISSWVVLHWVHSTDTQNPESARIGASYVLGKLGVFDGAPVSGAFFLSLLAALVVWLLLARSVRGFEIRATGANPEAAATAGISVAKMRLWAMALGGGLAGLVGVAEVLGNSERFRIGFSPDYGFIGIPVALLARCNPIGVVLSALMFGALQKGTADLDLETTYVTRDLASLIQALVVLCVSIEGYWAIVVRRRKRA